MNIQSPFSNPSQRGKSNYPLMSGNILIHPVECSNHFSSHLLDLAQYIFVWFHLSSCNLHTWHPCEWDLPKVFIKNSLQNKCALIVNQLLKNTDYTIVYNIGQHFLQESIHFLQNVIPNCNMLVKVIFAIFKWIYILPDFLSTQLHLWYS